MGCGKNSRCCVVLLGTTFMTEDQPAHDAFQQHRDWCNECRYGHGETTIGLCKTGHELWLASGREAEKTLRKIWGKDDGKAQA